MIPYELKHEAKRLFDRIYEFMAEMWPIALLVFVSAFLGAWAGC